MIVGKAVGIGASDKIVFGPGVALYNTHGDPIALVVEVGPNLTKLYSVAINEDEFRNALKQYGIVPELRVNELKL